MRKKKRKETDVINERIEEINERRREDGKGKKGEKEERGVGKEGRK